MITVFTDAASNGNPGDSAAGIVIKQGTFLHEYSYPLGVYNNHEAEFQAVIKALELCQKQFPNDILSIRSDSKVVVDTIERNFTKNENFTGYLKRIQNLVDTFPHVFLKWIPEKQNKQADKLARSCLKKQTKLK